MMPYTGYPPAPAPMPFGPPPVPPPVPMGPRRAQRRTAIVLGVVAVLLFLTAGVFAGLYVVASGDSDEVAERHDGRRTELTGVTDQVAATDEARDEAEQRNDGLETTRSELAACVDVAQRWLWDGLAGTERTVVLDKMFTLCE